MSAALYESNRTPPIPEPPQGHCLRCGTDIPYNPQASYCASCSRVWKRYENHAFAEKYFHSCDTSHQTSMVRPLCRACYFVEKNGQDPAQF